MTIGLEAVKVVGVVLSVVLADGWINRTKGKHTENKKRQRKQINQKRVKKAINKTSIDGDSQAMCYVDKDKGLSKGRGMKKGVGGWILQPCDRQIAKRIPWGMLLLIFCILYSVTRFQLLLLLHFHFHLHLRLLFRVCVAFSFCKFVLLVPFGFISVSFVPLSFLPTVHQF